MVVLCCRALALRALRACLAGQLIIISLCCAPLWAFGFYPRSVFVEPSERHAIGFLSNEMAHSRILHFAQSKLRYVLRAHS